MARLTLQLGTALVVPISAPRRLSKAWRLRSLAEAALSSPGERRGRSALDGGDFGGSAPRAITLHHPDPCPTGQMSGTPMVPVILAGLLLAGCDTVVPVPTTVEMPGMPNPEAALQQSIHHVDAEMAELGEMSPTMALAAELVVPEDLRRTVSFAWNGPLDAAVEKLAASIGYTFYTSGPATQKPLTVAIQISSVPVYQVFQALGEEAGMQATVQLDPQHHQVQVIHHV